MKLKQELCASDCPPLAEYPVLPPKVLIGKMAESVVSKRRAALATFLIECLDKCAAEDSVAAAEREELLLQFLEVQLPSPTEHGEASALLEAAHEETEGDDAKRRREFRSVGDDDVSDTDDEGFEYASSRHSLSAFSFPSGSQGIPRGNRDTQKSLFVVIVVVLLFISSLLVHMYHIENTKVFVD